MDKEFKNKILKTIENQNKFENEAKEVYKNMTTEEKNDFFYEHYDIVDEEFDPSDSGIMRKMLFELISKRFDENFEK
jgi:hypothetical protein